MSKMRTLLPCQQRTYLINRLLGMASLACINLLCQLSQGLLSSLSVQGLILCVGVKEPVSNRDRVSCGTSTSLADSSRSRIQNIDIAKRP